MDTPSTSGSQQDHEALIAEKVQPWQSCICEILYKDACMPIEYLLLDSAQRRCCPGLVIGLATLLLGVAQATPSLLFEKAKLLIGAIIHAGCVPGHA